MIIRKYQSSDCRKLAELFYNTVHTVNAKDYTQKQLNAWAPDLIDFDKWNESFLGHYTLLAIEDNTIVGFGDIDSSGYLDRLFTHKDYQSKGIATAICNMLEASVSGNIITHASLTAKPFFEKRGYRVIKKQQIQRGGISLNNFVMEKKSLC